MRFILGICLLILASGCLEGQLSPAEAQLCLLSTRVEPSLLPKCGSSQECEEKLLTFFPATAFQNIPVGTDSIRARKGVAGAWSKIHRAAQALEKVHQSCTTMEAATILPRVVTSAGELQSALKASEEAQEFTYRALEKSIEYGSTLELEQVKDTKAFEKYAQLLEKGHELQTRNATSEWAQAQVENRAYFEGVSNTIGQNNAGKYGVEWENVFEVYKTGVSIAAPERARIITMVSPLWQGALSAFLGNSASSNALSIVTKIKGNEVIVHVERLVSPQNGIVMRVWENMIEFDEQMNELAQNEIKKEEEIGKTISDAQQTIQNEEKKIEKWKGVSRAITSWSRARGESVPIGEYWNVREELTQLETGASALQRARAEDAMPIGRRMGEWRELEKKVQDVVQKMRENDTLNEEWRKKCETVLKENEIVQNTAIRTVEECQSGVDALQEKIILEVDVQKQARGNELEACVRELNEVERALGREETLEEWFTYYFDEGSVHACESARMNAWNEYDNTPLTQEWVEKLGGIEQYVTVAQYATATLAWSGKENAKSAIDRAQVILTSEQRPLTASEIRENMKEVNLVERELEQIVDEIVNEAASRTKWRIVSPSVIHVNEEEEIEWEGRITAHWGDSLAHSFVTSTPNPGVEAMTEWGENTQGTVEEDKIILQGDVLPEKEIIIRGRGKAVAATLETTSRVVNVVGNQAKIIQKDTLTSVFAPIRVHWEWDAPAGMERSEITVTANGKKIEPSGKTIEMIATTEKTLITYEYTAKNVVAVDTRIKNQRNEWGRTYTEYSVMAKNALSDEIVASIYTGVSGDPVLTEAVLVTNEDGGKVDDSLDAAGTIVLAKQHMGGKQERKYTITIEIADGIEEWMSLIERLRLELEGLMQSNSEKITKDAVKLKIKLIGLQGEKNSADIATKLISIQTEVSALLLAEEEYQKELVALESEKQKTQMERKVETAGEKVGVEPEHVMDKTKETLEMALKNVAEYEKAMNIGCEKLSLVNFVCPLTEDMVRAHKKIVENDKKGIEKLEAKWRKLSVEKQGEEWQVTHSTWEKMDEEMSKVNNEMDAGLRVLRNATVERVNKLKQEAKGNSNEEILSAVEKATLNVENGEFGKGIFVAQSTLNYLSGNKMTGLVTVPMLAWPFLGIIIVVGAWLGWTEWKKKNSVPIPIKNVPRGSATFTAEKKIVASEHPPTRGEFRRGDTRARGQHTQVQPAMLARIEEESFPQMRNRGMQQQREGPRSLKGE